MFGFFLLNKFYSISFFWVQKRAEALHKFYVWFDCSNSILAVQYVWIGGIWLNKID